MPAINPQVLDMDGCGDVDRALGHRWTSTSVSVSTAYGAVAGYGIQNAATATRYFDPIEWPIIGFHLNIRGATDRKKLLSCPNSASARERSSRRR